MNGDIFLRFFRNRVIVDMMGGDFFGGADAPDTGQLGFWLQ